MLAAAQRLRRSGDFAVTIRAGRRAGRGVLVVHLRLPDVVATASTGPARAKDSESVSPVRAGFVVSRTVGNAVVRNTVRRRLQHLVRDRLDSLPAGAILIVRALPGAATAPYARLAVDLDAAIGAVQAPGRQTRRQAGRTR